MTLQQLPYFSTNYSMK